MKKLLPFLLLIISYSLQGQEILSYQSSEGIIDFKVSNNQYFVKFKKESKEEVKRKAKGFIELSDTTALITVVKGINNFTSRKITIAKEFENQIENIEPVLLYKDSTRQVCNGQIVLKLNGKASLNEILTDWKYHSKQIMFVENQYLVTIENISTQELLLIVSHLNKNRFIEFAEPNFTRFLKPHTSDPLYGSQWAIDNQGYLGGTIDADMDADGAWNYATGQGIKVAIIDEGVDLTHDDLTPNLLQGYDATGNNSLGAPQGNDSHGTNCAGIVAAVANNGIGIAGVAYNSKIIPVRIAYGDGNGGWTTSDTWIADGINWAVNNGADILSCSWGGGSSSTAINNAIDNAVNNGRNINGVKKGCIVLFSSGNHNTSVAWPASRSNVIAVGATNMFDERKSPATADRDECWYSDCHGGSNYGTGIDVVAPGVKIYATDISGSAGYSGSDYYSSFNGTSAACPHAAATAALILSVNPNLSQSQVRQILESKTDKISGYTFFI